MKSLSICLVGSVILASCKEPSAEVLAAEKGASHFISNVPYFSQHDNASEPDATCNNTALAMSLNHLASKKNGLEKLQQYVPDYIYSLAKKLNDGTKIVTFLESRHSGLVDVCHTKQGHMDMMRAYISRGVPVILQNNFSDVGHFVVIDGYDNSKKVWRVQDPIGEWTQQSQSYFDGSKWTAYKLNVLRKPGDPKPTTGNKFGKDVLYSYSAVGKYSTDAKTETDRTYWITMVMPKGAIAFNPSSCEILK